MDDRKSSNSLATKWSGLVSARFQQIALTLLLLVSLFKGITWSLLIPPLYGFDEPMHLMYGRSIVNTHSLRIKPSTLVPLDIWELDEPAAKRTQLKSAVSPRDVYHDDVEQIVATHPNFYTYHPPLYYCLVAAVGACLHQAPANLEVVACRFISILLGICTAVLAYFAGKTFWKEEKSIAPIAMAVIVIYQPMSAFSFATITNSALEITLFSAMLVIGMQIIYQGFTKNLSVLLSIVLVAGMLNKLSFIATAPLVLLLLIWNCSNQSNFMISLRNLALRLFVVALPSALASYLWYQRGWQPGGDSLVHSLETQIHPEPFSFLRYHKTVVRVIWQSRYVLFWTFWLARRRTISSTDPVVDIGNVCLCSDIIRAWVTSTAGV